MIRPLTEKAKDYVRLALKILPLDTVKHAVGLAWQKADAQKKNISIFHIKQALILLNIDPHTFEYQEEEDNNE